MITKNKKGNLGDLGTIISLIVFLAVVIMMCQVIFEELNSEINPQLNGVESVNTILTTLEGSSFLIFMIFLFPIILFIVYQIWLFFRNSSLCGDFSDDDDDKDLEECDECGKEFAEKDMVGDWEICKSCINKAKTAKGLSYEIYSFECDKCGEQKDREDLLNFPEGGIFICLSCIKDCFPEYKTELTKTEPTKIEPIEWFKSKTIPKETDGIIEKPKNKKTKDLI